MRSQTASVFSMSNKVLRSNILTALFYSNTRSNYSFNAFASHQAEKHRNKNM